MDWERHYRNMNVATMGVLALLSLVLLLAAQGGRWLLVVVIAGAMVGNVWAWRFRRRIHFDWREWRERR